jgi:hypothetical protein
VYIAKGEIMVQVNIKPKLSTAKIRELMKDWLIKAWPDALDCYEDGEMIEDHKLEWQGNTQVIVQATQQDLDNDAEFMGLKSGLTIEQIRDGVKALWHNPNNWKRHEKHKLGGEFGNFFRKSYNRATGKYDGPVAFDIDKSGEYNQELVSKFGNDDSLSKECIHRVFIPDDGLGETFRIEVITTPDDNEVIGWTLISD